MWRAPACGQNHSNNTPTRGLEVGPHDLAARTYQARTRLRPTDSGPYTVLTLVSTACCRTEKATAGLKTRPARRYTWKLCCITAQTSAPHASSSSWPPPPPSAKRPRTGRSLAAGAGTPSPPRARHALGRAARRTRRGRPRRHPRWQWAPVNAGSHMSTGHSAAERQRAWARALKDQPRKTKRVRALGGDTPSL